MESRLHDQISSGIVVWSDPLDLSSYSMPLTFDSEGNVPVPTTPMLESRASTSRFKHCTDLTMTRQPAPASHFIAMVCDNSFINHIPEDCIIDGYISDCSISTTDHVSLSDMEGSEADVIFIADTEGGEELWHQLPGSEMISQP